MRMITLFGLALCSSTVNAEDRVEKLDKILRQTTRNFGVPGLVAAVVKDGKVVAIGAAGVREKGKKEPITISDKLHIGSCTKAMTATLAARLVEKGKIRWTTPLSRATLPVFRNKMNREYAKVPLQDLLNHGAGCPTDLNPKLWERLWKIKDGKKARRELLRAVTVTPPVAQRGKFHYSNTGYALAGLMLEQTMGKDYIKLMKEEVFEPLGMKSAGFGSPGTNEKVDQPRGHTLEGKVVEPGPDADNPPVFSPAGRVHCTIDDWAKFVIEHMQGDRGRSKYLKLAAYRVLHNGGTQRARGENYAGGWLSTRRNWGGGPVLTHAGSNTYWYSEVWAAPRKNFAVLVVCNQGGNRAKTACTAVTVTLINKFK